MAEVNYGYRDNRGASYMDTYDRQQNSEQYDLNEKGSDDGCCAACSKHFLFFVNFFLFLVGIVLIIVGIYILQNGVGDTDSPEFGNIEVLPWFAIISGICVTLVGFCGCGSAASNKRWILIAYISFLIFILLIEIALVIVAIAFESSLKSQLRDQWNDYSDDEKEDVEEHYDCEGFNDCYKEIKDEASTNIAIILGVAVGVAIYDVIMIVVSICLCKKRASG